MAGLIKAGVTLNRKMLAEIGFVDVCDRPYPELCRAARKLGGEIYVKRDDSRFW